MDTIKVARLQPDAWLPSRKHPSDAGLDVYALRVVRVQAHTYQVVPTGITIDIPDGYFGLLKPKGKNNHLIGAGVIDAGYQGEILVKVVNPYDIDLEFSAGEAIGQLLLLPIATPAVEEVSLSAIHTAATPRGGSGGIHKT